MSKRTFIAIHIRPEKELLAFIRQLQEELKNSTIKWVNPDSMHLTLRFLGGTTREQIGRILKEAPLLLNRQASFEIELTGFGKFGSAQKPKVLWVGAAGGDDLAGLAATTEEIVRNLGFDGDERVFRPHLTLGRVKWLKEVQNLKKLLDDYHDVAFQRMMVNEVVFYESILRPAGPLYRPIQKFKLEG